MTEVPFFAVATLPHAERVHGSQLLNALSRVERYNRNFCDAVSLYEMSEPEYWRNNETMINSYESQDQMHTAMKRKELFAGFMQMAARDAVMTLYHFGCAMNSVSKEVNLSPTLKKCFDKKQMKAANKRFNEAFSTSKEMRDAVAHAAEQDAATHSMPNGLFISEMLSGCNFSVGRKGELLTMALNRKTLAELRQIATHVYDACRPMENWQQFTQPTMPTPPDF